MIDPIKMDLKINKFIIDYSSTSSSSNLQMKNSFQQMVKDTGKLPNGRKRAYKKELFQLKKQFKL